MFMRENNNNTTTATTQLNNTAAAAAAAFGCTRLMALIRRVMEIIKF